MTEAKAEMISVGLGGPTRRAGSSLQKLERQGPESPRSLPEGHGLCHLGFGSRRPIPGVQPPGLWGDKPAVSRVWYLVPAATGTSHCASAPRVAVCLGARRTPRRGPQPLPGCGVMWYLPVVRDVAQATPESPPSVTARGRTVRGRRESGPPSGAGSSPRSSPRPGGPV